MAYLSPGVYVEEVPSAIKPIAGVGTSTAGFIGLVPDSLTVPVKSVTNERLGAGDGTKTSFTLPYPILTDAGSFAVRVNGTAADATVSADGGSGNGVVKLTNAPPDKANITGDFVQAAQVTPVPAGQVVLCTTFSDFVRAFGDFSLDPGQRQLAHAVYGFFDNGGTRCFVSREKGTATIASSSLHNFEAIDEIAIVAAPGLTDAATRDAIVTHCKIRTGDRFAILDVAEAVETGGSLDLELLDPSNPASLLPSSTDFGAAYFPWISVFDPPTKLLQPAGDGTVEVAPSGHVAGIYARVDTTRGVHKAPANEPVMGALALRYRISKAQQDGLNPQGVNVIRNLNGAITVWGARTIGGDANADLKYVSTRRLLLYLKKSIDQGTQWVVFEPNDPSLWARITRNVTAFLTNVWRAGALFGTTPQEAFFVKCDAETNPPELRDVGQIVTEIGVAIVRPAEFVIFRISQWAGPTQ